LFLVCEEDKVLHWLRLGSISILFVELAAEGDFIGNESEGGKE
jgi:hypothetical protein